MKFPALIPISYQGNVFRNIFTCSPTQELWDDVCGPAESPVVDALVQQTSEIAHDSSQVQRPFQYGAVEDEEILAVFKKENWRAGRFGDGREYGVWCGAEEDVTNVVEACWVAFQLGKDNVLNHGEVYTTDRGMYGVQIASERAIDLTGEQEFLPWLTHPSDYEFCQELGKKIVKDRFELLRTLSARRREGVCTPLFSPTPIQKWNFLYYFKIHIHPSGFIGVSSSKKEMNFSLEASSLVNPSIIPHGDRDG